TALAASSPSLYRRNGCPQFGEFQRPQPGNRVSKGLATPGIGLALLSRLQLTDSHWGLRLVHSLPLLDLAIDDKEAEAPSNSATQAQRPTTGKRIVTTGNRCSRWLGALRRGNRRACCPQTLPVRPAS